MFLHVRHRSRGVFWHEEGLKWQEKGKGGK
jgi:hypothetical protein